MFRAETMHDAERIFRAGVRRVDPVRLIGSALELEGDRLHVHAEGDELAIDLASFDRILAFGAGKASARMALGLERLLGERLAGGLVAVKRGYVEELSRIRILEASHPVPDRSSLEAARAMLSLARGGDARTLFVGLTSGGASSLLCLPLGGKLALGLEDKMEATKLLLASGAAIGEVNCVRKHLSAIKGGRLARAFGEARVLNLVLSDVVGDELATIASGLTVPDPTSYADALAVIQGRGLRGAMPAAVIAALEAGSRGEAEESPKPGDPAFARVTNVLAGSNRLALLAAREEAERLGYRCLVLGSRLEGEARELAARFYGIASGIRAADDPLRPPACVLAGGESTVTVRGRGRGGRNQEMALAFLAAARRAGRGLDGVCFLSAGTDGSDGPTDAAGAFASAETLDAAKAAGLSPEAFLQENDSYGFFSRLGEGALLKTGPTNTNVCDIQVLLLRRAPP